MDPNRVIGSYEKYIYDTFRIKTETLCEIIRKYFKIGDVLYAVNIGDVKLESLTYKIGERELMGIVVRTLTTRKQFILDVDGALDKGMPSILYPSKDVMNWDKYRTFYPKDYEPASFFKKDDFLKDIAEGAKMYLFLQSKMEVYNKMTTDLDKIDKGHYSILSLRFKNDGYRNEAYYHIVKNIYNPLQKDWQSTDLKLRFLSEESAIQFYINYRDILYDDRFILFYAHTYANYRYDGKCLNRVNENRYELK